MANHTLLPSWVTTWIVIATLLVSIDSVYIIGISLGLSKYIPAAIMKTWGWYGESDTQYSHTGQGIQDSGGWVITQSKFNVLELCGQLVFLLFLKKDDPASLLLIMLTSMATLWKTLM